MNTVIVMRSRYWTAKACGLEPYAYLRHLYTHLPRAASVEDIEALLPGNIDPKHLGA
jgi:transposase